MLVGIISDIHSNYNALEVAGKYLETFDCEVKLCLGDMVGYYDKPNEVINYLKRNDYKCIKGNHERYVLGELNYVFQNEEVYGIKRHRKIISQENFRYIELCDAYLDFTLQERRIIAFHGTKEDSEKYLNDIDGLDNSITAKYDICLFGHTHRPFYRVVNNCQIINPGSVGQPRDYNPMSSFAIYNTEINSVNFYRVGYDVDSYANELKIMNYDERLVNILLRKE